MKEQSMLLSAGVCLRLPSSAAGELDDVVEVFARQVGARCRETTAPGTSCVIELAVEASLGADAFAISTGQDGAIRVCGGDRRGLLYGLGKLLHDARFEPGRFIPGSWRGVSRPAKPVRGIYLATHFYNFYQTAPVEQIERYIEELALWGMNTLAVWYDMHHFHGFDDPEAIAFRDRLRCILRAAQRLGLDIWLLVVGNEAYANSRAELRAAPGGGRGGYYEVAVCPSKPEGVAYILDILGEYFDWARDLQPAAVCIWPYDQGGCGCPDCQPWGAQGFMRCVDAVGALAREKLSGTKIVLSTWYMNHAEWVEVARQVWARPSLAEALLMECFHDPPGPAPLASAAAQALPVVGFPEISMHDMFPWGGFGANPQPQRFHSQWKANQLSLAGGFPYSEGIFEDLNKVLWLQMYWDCDAMVPEVLDQYIRYEFGLTDSAPVREVILTLERNHHFRWWDGKLDGVRIMMDWFPSRGAQPQADPGVRNCSI